jgi:FkbM family methyltransferase
MIKIEFEEPAGTPPLYLRPGTSDEDIFAANFNGRSEYPFPETANPKVILDIGANIGIISVIMANLYPDAKIYAFEPDPENFEMLKKNTAGYPNIIIQMAGLGSKNESRKLYASDNPTNFGGKTLHSLGADLTKDPVSVLIIDVAQFIETIGGKVDLIKSDCEGAEHEIFTSMTDQQLSHVKFILGELHGTQDYELLRHLDSKFNLQFAKPLRSRVWHFVAQKKDSRA